MPAKRASATTVILVDPGVKEVACDGGGVMGHPLVYLPFGKKDSIVCYYCGRRFQKESAKINS